MLKPIGLVSGHYECRSFTESLPILKELLALDLTHLEAVTESTDGASFILADLNNNWWEITSATS